MKSPIRINRLLSALGHGMVARQVVLPALLCLVALELCLLGLGLVRRLELANEHALEVSRAQLAVIEAGRDDMAPGSAGIAATQEESDPDAPPPLRPRDVETILSQEGAAPELPETPAEQAPAEVSQEAAVDTAADEAAETVAGRALSPEDREELDLLIRKGVSALVAGDIRQCILALEEAERIAPDHPAALYYRGMAYDKLLNPGKAREYFTRVFRMRDAAGVYFARASRRLTYGFEQPGALRGKLSFGPFQLRHSDEPEQGERVEILLPVLLAPGEEVRPDDIYISIQFFDLVNGRKIEFSRLASPKLAWQSEKPTWQEWEENLLITYAVPALTQEELDAYGDLKYYGFTAKLYYKGEPLDCLSSPSALILQEQRLNSRRARRTNSYNNGLLPDDGLDPGYEEALPMSDFLDQLDSPAP
ncbi:MAG: tetratricopeptide repeat protein [Akkermansia sp.]